MQTISKLKDKVNAKQLVTDFTDFVAISKDIIKFKDNIAFYVGKNQVYLFYTKEDKTITLFVSSIEKSTKTGLKLCKDKFSFELSHLIKGDDQYVGEKAFEFTYEKDLNEMIREILNNPNMDDTKLVDTLKKARNKPKELQIKTMQSMTKGYYEIIQDLNPVLNHPIFTLEDLIEDNQQRAKQASSHSAQMLIELNFLNEMCLNNSIIGDKKAIIFNDLDNQFYIDKKSMHVIFSSQNASFVAVQENETSWKIYSTGMYDNYSEPKELITVLNSEEGKTQEFDVKNMAAHIVNAQLVYLNAWSDYMSNSLSFAAQEAESEFGENMSFPVNLASVNYQLAKLYEMSSGIWKDKASIYSYLFGVLGNGYYATANGEFTSSRTNYDGNLAQNMDAIVAQIPQGKIESLTMLYDDALNSFNGKIEANWANCINEFCDMLEEYKNNESTNFTEEDRVSVKDINTWIKKAKALTNPQTAKTKIKVK